jgi:hypothetical protein
VDRLLWEVLALVLQDILYPIRVSLKEKTSLPAFLRLIQVLLYSFVFASAMPSSRRY